MASPMATQRSLGYSTSMKTFAGEVVNGCVRVPIPNGTLVTILVDDVDGHASPNDNDMAELRAAQANIDAGQYMSGDALFAYLASKG
jgi:hypothetical protein